ncbi:MAG: ammonium transporter, partial [Phormidesmis sp.]
FYTISGGLAGIISVGAGLDLYSPAIVILIAFIGAYTMPFVGRAVEKAGIDDAVGAFAVHGYCGVIGAMAVGVMATGYPQGDGIPLTGFFGQLVGTIVCTVVLGFIPGYGVSFVLSKLGMLRVSPEEEIAGLDLAEYSMAGYPEYPVLAEQNGHIPTSATPISQASARV